MKGTFILSACLFFGATLALPAQNPRWQLVPDGDGRMHLIDITAVVVEPEQTWDPIVDVFFVLYTRRNPTVGYRLERTLESVQNSNWAVGGVGGTRFTIHGWNNNHQGDVNTELTREFLIRGDHNVIAVDWSAGNSPNYITSRNRVVDVAVQVAAFIDWLHLNGLMVSFNRLVLAGHSLGAHVAGVTGKLLARGRAQAIFGLDPAGPLFSINEEFERLDPGSAVYTEMIATNAGLLGFDQPIAHSTFYPNWGSSQPGCGTDLAGGCAHARVIPLYAESINSERFVSIRCADYEAITGRTCAQGLGLGVMGGESSKLLEGVFFLETNAAAPFARG